MKKKIKGKPLGRLKKSVVKNARAGVRAMSKESVKKAMKRGC